MRQSSNPGSFGLRRIFLKRTALLMSALLILPVLLSGCGKDDKIEIPIADYGSYGSDIATGLATGFPYRKAYSAEEKGAGEYVKSEFEKLGYTVTEQVFDRGS